MAQRTKKNDNADHGTHQHGLGRWRCTGKGWLQFRPSDIPTEKRQAPTVGVSDLDYTRGSQGPCRDCSSARKDRSRSGTAARIVAIDGGSPRVSDQGCYFPSAFFTS